MFDVELKCMHRLGPGDACRIRRVYATAADHCAPGTLGGCSRSGAAAVGHAGVYASGHPHPPAGQLHGAAWHAA
jgi:hypothetical protein